MSRHIMAIILLAAAGADAAHAQTSFTRGHIFVAMAESEACDFGGREWIVEIDPETGANWVFADSDDGICVVSGLRFTPDGTQLLATNAGHLSPSFDNGWIQAFNPDGTSQVILDGTDGLERPLGSNALAFDAFGDLYVVSGENSFILKFSGLSPPATIFADDSDGVSIRGALDFAPSGNLYYAKWSFGILRFSPDGQVSTLDPLGTRCLDVDRFGNIFITGGGSIYRFDCEDSATEHVLSSGFRVSAFNMLVASADARTLYFAENGGDVYALDATDGTGSIISAIPVSIIPGSPRGITLYDPVLFGDISGDFQRDLRDFAWIANCFVQNELGSFPCECRPADLDLDGAILLEDWGFLISLLDVPKQ